MKTLPQGVYTVLQTCPPAGTGVHDWLFTASLKLWQFDLKDYEIVTLLREATANCGREVPDRETEAAVRDSKAASEDRLAVWRPPRWPKVNAERVQAILQGGQGLSHLEESSPVRWNDDKPHTEEIVDVLFPGNPLLCAGPKQEVAITRPRSEWCGFLNRQQFIVPNPMCSPFGMTKDGKRSARCLANTGPRRFLIVEFDQGSFDEHAALLLHLSTLAPLVMAVHSAGKSIHGWFFTAGEPDDKIDKFFRYAVSLGADHHMDTPCQFCRMPDGVRDTGARQRVVLFNPKAVEAK